MMDIGIGAAFVAGILSFVSPCVFPLVPPYLAYLAGVSFSEMTDADRSSQISWRVFWVSLFFVLGFVTIFMLLGATASVLGKTLTQYFDTLAVVAGIVIIVMGMHFLGLLRIPILYREARFHVAGRPASFAGAYVMGLAFAFGWTPCVGPALATILFLAGAEDTAYRGALLLGFYSLGMGIPFLIAGLFAHRFGAWAERFRRHLGKAEKAMGGLLVVTGALIITGSMSIIAQWLIETFPMFQKIG
jgi:cytochrome c-type biogenesis protein